MEKFKILVFTIVACIVFFTFAENKHLRKQNAIMQNNVSTLLDTATHYKVADSLNAARVNELVLENKQFKKYRAEDAALIKQLKTGKPKEVVKVVTETHTEIVTKLDTSYIDMSKHFCYDDKWTKVEGSVYCDSVKLDIKNYEDLVIVESVQKKKFLFIKLPIKLFGYKHRQIDVVSKNPHTQILSTEFITLK